MLAVSWITPVLATQDEPLTRAELYKLIKTVELLLQNQTPRPAKPNDIMVPRDAVRTGVSSEAQLFFNDKSLIPVPPFLRGVRGDQQVPKITAKYFSNNLLERSKINTARLS